VAEHRPFDLVAEKIDLHTETVPPTSRFTTENAVDILSIASDFGTPAIVLISKGQKFVMTCWVEDGDMSTQNKTAHTDSEPCLA